jgi:hypothetical protein
MNSDSQMNILEAYIKKNKQFIVLILGMPCTSKSKIAKELVVDLGLPLININDYLIEDKFIDKNIDGINFKLYEHPDNYDWEKLDKDVNKIKSKGLVLYGNYIDMEKINFNLDFVFFFNMNVNLCKSMLIKKKLLPYKLDDEKVKKYFTDVFNPVYDDLKQKITINKFFNIKEQTVFDSLYDEVFDTLMELINKNL